MSTDLFAELRTNAQDLINLGLLKTGETTMKQHHFVISYDTETKLWSWDVDQEELRFDDGTIYNKETGEWSSGYLGDGQYEEQDGELSSILQTNIRAMNGDN